MFDFDTGGGGSEGPWIQWSARGTQDGEIPPRSFLLRTQDGKEPLAAFERGVVLDIHNMKTGWCRSDGVAGQAPTWQWNPTLSSFAPRPDDSWKKGFTIRCAISKDRAATWEQSGAGAWNAFVNIVPAIQKAGSEVAAGKLPVVKMVDVKVEKFARGSTATPILEIIKWVERPDCLKEGAAAGIATEEAPAQAAQQPASTPADDEFAEF